MRSLSNEILAQALSAKAPANPPDRRQTLTLAAESLPIMDRHPRTLSMSLAATQSLSFVTEFEGGARFPKD